MPSLTICSLFIQCFDYNVCYLVCFICETSAFSFLRVEFRVMTILMKRIVFNCRKRKNDQIHFLASTVHVKSVYIQNLLLV